ncbi:hypothetical protein CPB83DRAFT_859319 [Crepidotus variabilis]|uniref:PAS domain-containing protein n=1 Tax=Crepidotus variabilis TaxID=179855 RepID=A0A9P6JLT0_9AGAR|nr:hypothetical protein CPB83DRAFT_859319 [Crepidotus variabilis]
MNTPTPNVSFIGIVDFSQEARWLYMTPSVADLLGFEPNELIGRPSLDLVHPDEFSQIRKLHYDTIQQDKAAVLVYLRMRHKDPYRGYVLCGVSRTVVHNVLVGSVSFASPAKALHNASTAQEITVITPSAANLSFRRWHDPSPMPPSPIPASMATIPESLLARVSSRATNTSVLSSSWGCKGPSRLNPRTSDSPRSTRASDAYTGDDTVNGPSSPTLSTSSLVTKSRSSSPSNCNISSIASPGSRNGGRSVARESGLSIVTRSSSSDSLVSLVSSASVSTPATSISPYGDLSDLTLSPLQIPEAFPVITFEPLANKSFRTALILDRFTMAATILYCSNDLLISTIDAIGRSIFDFVAKKDEEQVKSWIQCVKGWGVNEKGQPSDGGFGFGKFTLQSEGRDSIKRMPEPPTPSRRSANTKRSGNGGGREIYTTRHGSRYRGDSVGSNTLVSSRVAPPPPAPNTSSLYDVEHFEVDAIFSAHSDGMIVILRRAS